MSSISPDLLYRPLNYNSYAFQVTSDDRSNFFNTPIISKITCIVLGILLFAGAGLMVAGLLGYTYTTWVGLSIFVISSVSLCIVLIRKNKPVAKHSILSDENCPLPKTSAPLSQNLGRRGSSEVSSSVTQQASSPDSAETPENNSPLVNLDFSAVIPSIPSAITSERTITVLDLPQARLLPEEVMKAIEQKDQKTVTVWIEANTISKIRKKDKDGNTLLHWAAELGWIDLVQSFLINEKIEVNVLNHAGNSPLHHACAAMELEIIVILFEKGGKIIENNQCRDVSHYEEIWKNKYNDPAPFLFFITGKLPVPDSYFIELSKKYIQSPPNEIKQLLYKQIKALSRLGYCPDPNFIKEADLEIIKLFVTKTNIQKYIETVYKAIASGDCGTIDYFLKFNPKCSCEKLVPALIKSNFIPIENKQNIAFIDHDDIPIRDITIIEELNKNYPDQLPVFLRKFGKNLSSSYALEITLSSSNLEILLKESNDLFEKGKYGDNERIFEFLISNLSVEYRTALISYILKEPTLYEEFLSCASKLFYRSKTKMLKRNSVFFEILKAIYNSEPNKYESQLHFVFSFLGKNLFLEDLFVHLQEILQSNSLLSDFSPIFRNNVAADFNLRIIRLLFDYGILEVSLNKVLENDAAILHLLDCFSLEIAANKNAINEKIKLLINNEEYDSAFLLLQKLSKGDCTYSLNFPFNDNNDSILHVILKWKNISQMYLFLDLFKEAFILKVDPNWKNNDQKTPLYLAHEKYELVEDLLGLGADINSRIDEYNSTLLIEASKETNKVGLWWLLNNGANPNLNDLAGNTALHYVPCNKDLNTAFDFCTALLESKADPKKVNNEGETFLTHSTLGKSLLSSNALTIMGDPSYSAYELWISPFTDVKNSKNFSHLHPFIICLAAMRKENRDILFQSFFQLTFKQRRILIQKIQENFSETECYDLLSTLPLLVLVACYQFCTNSLASQIRNEVEEAAEFYNLQLPTFEEAYSTLDDALSKEKENPKVLKEALTALSQTLREIISAFEIFVDQHEDNGPLYDRKLLTHSVAELYSGAKNLNLQVAKLFHHSYLNPKVDVAEEEEEAYGYMVELFNTKEFSVALKDFGNIYALGILNSNDLCCLGLSSPELKSGLTKLNKITVKTANIEELSLEVKKELQPFVTFCAKVLKVGLVAPNAESFEDVQKLKSFYQEIYSKTVCAYTQQKGLQEYWKTLNDQGIESLSAWHAQLSKESQSPIEPLFFYDVESYIN